MEGWTIMKRSEALTWSKMDTMPILWHDDKLNTDLVAWNGIMMNVEHGLMVASALLLNIFPTPEMKRMADKQWADLVDKGAFGNVDWDVNVWVDSFQSSTLYSYYMRKITPISDKLQKMTPESIFSIFNLNYK